MKTYFILMTFALLAACHVGPIRHTRGPGRSGIQRSGFRSVQRNSVRHVASCATSGCCPKRKMVGNIQQT